MNGFSRLFSQPLGYVIIRVQVEGVWGYDEDQETLVIPDPTNFGFQVLVILGTPTINQITNMIKESEIDEGYPICWYVIKQSSLLRQRQL